jgi:hypothetical protein
MVEQPVPIGGHLGPLKDAINKGTKAAAAIGV